MYGQEGSFNPHYCHGAPPQAGVTGPFPQQPRPPLPPQQQQQAGVTGPLPQQPVPPPPAPYPQHSIMRPPPGPYRHSVSQFQNPAYPFTQHDQMHQGPMGPQQAGFAPMPISGPPPLAMYKAPQYPMQRPLPPPPPQPSSFAPENVPPPSQPPPPPPPLAPQYPMQSPLPPPPPQPSSFAPEKVPPPSHPPPPPPPPPPPSPPPLPPQYPMQRPLPPPPPQPSSFAPENVLPPSHPPPPPPPLPPPSPPPLAPALPISPDGCDGAKTEKAETQLIVSDDSDMDMDGDENAKTANVTVEGGSPFRLIQGYSSDENEEESNAGVGSTLVTLHKDNEHSHLSDRNTETCHQKLANAKGNVNIPHGTEQNDEARKYHLKLKDESNPMKHDIDVPGHIVKDDLSGSEFDVVQRSKRHGRSQRKRSRSKSPQGRSYSLLGANKCSPSQSLSPGRQSRSPLAKQVHPTGEGKDSEDRIDLQEGLAGAEKLDSSSNNLNSKKGENTAPDGALGQQSFDDNLTSEFSQSVVASANASGAHKLQRTCPPSQSRSDLNVLSSAGNESLTNQSSGGVPFPSVQGTMSYMALDMPLADSQSLCPPEHMSSSFAQAHPSSSNMIQPTGLSSVATSGLPQTQFQQNVTAPANEFQQNQMRSYPAPDLSHPRPLNLNDQTLQPVTSHQQSVAIPVENASVPHPDRWSNYSSIIGLPCSHHQPPYGQQQLPGNLDSGTNLVYPSFQRFPSNLPGSSDLGPVDVGLQSSIKPHFNPFASTFEQTDPCLGIDLTLSPHAVGSFSAKAVEHMNTLSPFDQSFPGSASHAHESSAEATRNKQKQFRPEFTSFAPYDPLIDSIEPSSNSINKVDPGKEKHWSAYGSRDASKLINIEVDSKDMLGLGVVAESEVEGLGEVAADTEAGVVENASPEFLGAKDWSSDIPGDFDNDQLLSKKAKDSRSMKLFKNAIADFVKEVLNPSWRQGNMSKEAFKTIVKRTVDKVSSSVPSSHIPKTPAKIEQYMQSSQKKVTKLVMGYVDKYVKL